MNLEDLKDVQCEKCEHTTFYQIFGLKKMSALVSPNGEETYVPVIKGFACNKCGHVNSEFNQDEKEKEKPKPDIILP